MGWGGGGRGRAKGGVRGPEAGVQRLGWLVGRSLGARQPKRAGRIRPDSFESLKKRIWLNSGRDKRGEGWG